jgi:hypothetical protein
VFAHSAETRDIHDLLPVWFADLDKIKVPCLEGDYLRHLSSVLNFGMIASIVIGKG